ncbi:MAG: oligosaccharide flippase family protein [Clostridia bacterium]|nr:oligosaccharide flippase family protein [Clostridia bacterium]
MGKRSNSQIKLGAIISYVALILNIVLGLLYTPWMKDQIGIADHGLYTLATSLISIFMLDFGLGSAVSRYVAKYRAEGNQKKIDDILGVIYKLYIIIDVIAFVVLFVIYFLLGVLPLKLDPEQIDKFKTLYLIVAGFNVLSFPFSPLNGVLNAYEKFIQLKLCDLISKVATVGFVVIALSFSSSVVWVVLANALSGMLVVAIKLIITGTSVDARANFKAGGKELYKSLFSFTIWTTVVSIMQRFTHSFGPTVLSFTAGDYEIGLYSPAVVIEGYLYTIAIAVNGLFLPKVSQYIADKKEEKITDLMIKVGRYQLILLGLIYVGFACVGKEFMVTWMRDIVYEKSYWCALIIMLPTVISATQQIANTTVIAKKLVKYQAICMIVTGTLGLVVSIVASLFLGSIGVCIGTAVASLANIVYMNFIYSKKAGINVFKYYKKCYLRAIPCFAIVIPLGLLVCHFIPLSSWIGIIVKGICVVAIYALVFLLIYFSKEDKKKLIDKIKGILKRKAK